MSLNLGTTKDIATIAGPLISVASPLTAAVVETWLKPKLADFFKKRKNEDAVIEQSLVNKFQEYLDRVYDRHSHITSVAFDNRPKILDDLYVPLTVVTEGERSEKQQAVQVKDFSQELLPKCQRVLITDTGGMGKSTLMKFLFISCIRANAGIPIFIDLRQLSEEKTIIETICDELNPIDEEFDTDFVLKLVRRGDFIFFFDGYDEISLDCRDVVTKDIQNFISKARANLFAMTSRPEDALASFSSFTRYTIRPLELEEAFELIRKCDSYGPRAEQLIGKLVGDTLRQVHEFLTNPLLVSLLYRAYEHKPTIPFRKDTFYRQVYDALFETHDYTKPGAFAREKRSKLGVDDFHRVLRRLGYITLPKGIGYTKDDLLAYVTEAKKSCPGIDFKESDFLKDLLTSVPLFVAEGDYHRWSHKSLQEYFAAQFICSDAKGSQGKILRQMRDSKKFAFYLNVLDLCCDIDYKTFRDTIVYDLLNDFMGHMKTSYAAYDGVVDTGDLNRRRGYCFDRQIVLIPPGPIEASSVFAEAEAIIRQEHQTPAGSEKIGNKTTTRFGGWHPENGGAYGVTTPSYRIAVILLQKHHDIVQSSSLHRFRQPLDQLWSTFLPDSKPLLVDEDPKSPLNEPTQFSSANQLIRQTSAPMPLFNYRKCVQLLREIDDDLQRENKDDYLVSDI